ncbi:hypothetical protein [Actinoplanes sp. GCM10030250]|uniref:hypothetical protein n=1 Tax=Actinoplanes sp. GCM10030250 TaxID=3273376 RepID=UPI00361C8797
MTSNADPDIAEPSELQGRSGAAFDRIIGNTVNTAIATWVSTSTGLPEAGATLGGTLGPLAEELSFAIRKIVGLRHRQAELMVARAADTASVSVSDLIDCLAEEPAKLQLLVVSLDAAGRAASEDKLDLVAKLLATGAISTDRALVDEQTLAMQAVADLEIFHLRLVAILDRPSPVWWKSMPLRQRLKFAWPEDRVLEQDPGLSATIAALTAKLQSLGIARSIASPLGDESILWELTDFGRLCMGTLRNRPVKEPLEEQD